MSESHEPTDQPLTQQDLERLSDAELSTWLRRALFRWVRCRRLSWERWQWRRATLRAMRTLGDRVRRPAGTSATLCDRCRQRPATIHWAYGEGDALRCGHFCDVCKRTEAPGWFGTSIARVRSASRS